MLFGKRLSVVKTSIINNPENDEEIKKLFDQIEDGDVAVPKQTIDYKTKLHEVHITNSVFICCADNVGGMGRKCSFITSTTTQQAIFQFAWVPEYYRKLFQMKIIFPWMHLKDCLRTINYYFSKILHSLRKYPGNLYIASEAEIPCQGLLKKLGEELNQLSQRMLRI
ncbi:hypothetical protein X798_04786 [Onchocerca flexuosa]|uniref:Uncharacterized protein n=1 Tax=Onchocerca flexuosa TaxID=387005 RepID=A0A238BU11_9BILA|nr:hypothetical protein X798_04786 [Onchocerca flexuosa]